MHDALGVGDRVELQDLAAQAHGCGDLAREPARRRPRRPDWPRGCAARCASGRCRSRGRPSRLPRRSRRRGCPGLGRTAGFSTIFWKIQGCEDRHALRRRTAGGARASMGAHFTRPRPCTGQDAPLYRAKSGAIPRVHAPADRRASRRPPRPAAARQAPRAARGAVEPGGGTRCCASCMRCQGSFASMRWTVTPRTAAGWLGMLTAPLLHGSPEHLMANALALLLLGTLAGSVYPRATVRAMPIAWIGSGVAAWLLGDAGSHHLGASGVLQGLAYLVVTLGLLRRDRASVAAAMIALRLLRRHAGDGVAARSDGVVAIASRRRDRRHRRGVPVPRQRPAGAAPALQLGVRRGRGPPDEDDQPSSR